TRRRHRPEQRVQRAGQGVRADQPAGNREPAPVLLQPAAAASARRWTRGRCTRRGGQARSGETAGTRDGRAWRGRRLGSRRGEGGAPVSVQSMTITLTADVDATLQQIAELTAAGCDIVRVAVPSQDDADALPAIAKKSQIPVIADIHFQPRYVFAAIDAGCAAVRVNPGNIKQFDDKVAEIARAAGDAGIPIRIGVNAGSLDKRLLAKYGKA